MHHGALTRYGASALKLSPAVRGASAAICLLLAAALGCDDSDVVAQPVDSGVTDAEVSEVPARPQDAAAAGMDAASAGTVMREIALANFASHAEDVDLESSGLVIVTLDGWFLFDLDGNPMPRPQAPPFGLATAGVDSFQSVWRASTHGNVVVFQGFELQADQLDDLGNGTGIAIRAGANGAYDRYYLADSMRAEITERTVDGVRTATLPLPGSDLQGLAFSPAGELYALDAHGARLLKLTPGVAGVAAEAPLPVQGRIPSGIHFDAQGALYVCFRDVPKVMVLRPSF